MTRHLAVLALTLAVTSCRPEADQWQPGSIHWDHMPLSLYWDRDEFPDYNKGIEKAANLYNKEVRCPIFHIVESPDADVVIGSRGAFPGSPAASKGAWADTTYLPAQNKVQIRLLQFGDIQVMYVVAQHELGHALGLAHDYGGIMKPQVGEFSLPRLLIPDPDDSARLRARYCR